MKEQSTYWIKALGLLMSDKGILQGHTSWLNSSIKDVSQQLLSNQFSKVAGFQSVGCAYMLSFTVQQTFIQQKIHDKDYWLTVSNIGTESTDTATVDAYDSLNRSLSNSLEQQTACIMSTEYNQPNSCMFYIKVVRKTVVCLQ